METRKINLDRKPLDTEYIQSKQNFQEVLAHHKIAKIPVWKKPLFYGAIGVASVATVVAIKSIDFKPNEEITDQVVVAQNDSPVEIPEQVIAEIPTVQVAQNFHPKSPSGKSIVSKVAEQECYAKNEETSEHELVYIPPVAEISSIVVKKKSRVPSLAGKTEGVISIEQLCADPKIRFEDDAVKVSSFNLQLTNGNEGVMIRVNGDKIPSYLCEALKDEPKDQLLFITDIQAEVEMKNVFVPAMNLELTAK